MEVAGATPSRVAGLQGGRGGRAEAAQLRVHPSGEVTVFSGSHSHGQGHETTFAQLVAAHLGIAPDRVRVVQGDTDRVPFGRGTAASRSLVLGGTAALRAADKIIAKGKRIAAHMLEAAAADVEFAAGRFTVAGTDRHVTFDQVARAAHVLHDYPIAEVEPGLDETAFVDPPGWTFPGGCHVAEVEVDPETGAIDLLRLTAADDVGVVVNPLIVDGQIHGGLAQGAGQALLEGCVFDTAAQMLTGSLMDYCLPRAADLVQMDVRMSPTPCPSNPIGAKGCAEVGAVGLPPAIVNAVLHALEPAGVHDLTMPITSHQVWAALKQARAANA